MRKSQYRFKRYFEVPKELFKINEKITVPQVRVITDDGGNLGVMDTVAAIAKAREMGLDLVEVFPKAVPPVAKILDYGQFKYWKEKEARKQKAHQKEVELKGVRLSLRIGAHDLEMRKQQALKFLVGGDKVRAEIILRGREREQNEMAKTIIRTFVQSLGAGIRVDQEMTQQMGKLSMIVYGNPKAAEQQVATPTDKDEADIE